MSPVRRVLVVVALAALFSSSAWAALAAEPDEVADAISVDGVFVESGSDLTDGDAGALVALARNQGEKLSIIVLTEHPIGGAVAFGDAVADRLADPGLLFVLTPEESAYAGVGSEYTVAELEAALEFADARLGNDTAYATNFVESLIGEDSEAPDTSSSGLSGVLVFLVIVAGLGLVVFWLMRRSRRQAEAATENQLMQARAEIQHQLDAIANDILDMEEEVRRADNDRVDELFNAAGDTYQAASDELAGADTPGELLEITNELDVAIWQLDSAEALLDGKAPPERPEPQRPEPALPQQPPTAPGGDGPLGLPPRPAYPAQGYERRPARRSGGISPSLIEMLIALGAGAMARRSPTRRPSGGLFGGRSPSRRSSPSSSRSRGSFLPGPRTHRSRSARPSRSTRSSRRGTGGRVRGGRKRRR